MFAEPYHFVKGQEEELLSKEVADTLEIQFQQKLRPMARDMPRRRRMKQPEKRTMIRRNRKRKHK